MKIKIFSKSSQSTHTSDLSYSNTSLASIRVTVLNDNEPIKVNVIEESLKCEVGMDIAQWIKQTESLSSNNFENKYFDAIVSRGEDAVPYIYDRLLEGPTHLVHALELIYPEEIKYKGFISLSQARRIWLKIIRRRLQL